jgi:hypothetical protein
MGREEEGQGERASASCQKPSLSAVQPPELIGVNPSSANPQLATTTQVTSFLQALVSSTAKWEYNSPTSYHCDI